MQMCSEFEGFPCNSALFGLVSYNDPCSLPCLDFQKVSLCHDLCHLTTRMGSDSLAPKLS